MTPEEFTFTKFANNAFYRRQNASLIDLTGVGPGQRIVDPHRAAPGDPCGECCDGDMDRAAQPGLGDGTGMGLQQHLGADPEILARASDLVGAGQGPYDGPCYSTYYSPY